MCDSNEQIQSIKCMLVGDSETGKTHIFKKFTNQSISPEYVPTIFDTSNVGAEASGGCKLNLGMWDSGEVPCTDCFILCYSVNARESFESIFDRWLPEINKHGDGPIVPIILAATKCDLMSRDYEKSEHSNEMSDCKFVTYAEGKSMQEKLGAKEFFSCSSSSNICISAMFQTMVDLAYTKKENETKPHNPIWKFSSPTILITGDKGIGKSSLIQSLIENQPAQAQYGGKTEEKTHEYYHNIVKDGCEFFFRIVESIMENELLDTLIDQVDVLVLCYAINDPFSFKNAEIFLHEKFKDKLKKYRVILIGTKSDLKDESTCAIPTIDGELLKEELKLTSFLECSTRTLENISQLFGVILDNAKKEVTITE